MVNVTVVAAPTMGGSSDTARLDAARTVAGTAMSARRPARTSVRRRGRIGGSGEEWPIIARPAAGVIPEGRPASAGPARLAP